MQKKLGLKKATLRDLDVTDSSALDGIAGADTECNCGTFAPYGNCTGSCWDTTYWNTCTGCAQCS
jgi:hypothetical protein